MASVGIKDKETKAQPHRSGLYHRLVPAYQALWPAVAQRNILECVSAYDFVPGSKVLEVGVGTGLSLRSYPNYISLTGVDLSEAMLAEAKELISDNDWKHIEVQPMNAEKLTFEDSSFDVVTSFHTVSVVSNPQAMMNEMVRVCKPGGRILMINHFRSENPWVARVVGSAGGITKHLGWRVDVGLAEITRDLPLRLDQCYKPNRLSFFTVLKATCKLDQVVTS